MSGIREEDFYKNAGAPSEEFQYCRYSLEPKDTDNVVEGDYDQFALVVNALYPYLRLTKRRGTHHFPVGMSSVVATDGYFAKLSNEERNELCPKIAWGIATQFLVNLKFDDSQKDYVQNYSDESLYSQYYKRFLQLFLSLRTGLKFKEVSEKEKELEFIEEHLRIENELWSRSTALEGYEPLYGYSRKFVEGYFAFVDTKKKGVLRDMKQDGKCYSTEIRSSFDTSYVKVFFKDDSLAEDARKAVLSRNSVKNVNITESGSKDHPGNTLTVYPKPMYSGIECEKEVKAALDDFFSREKRGNMQVHNEAYFRNIEQSIISHLDKAMATIDVCVAWFTNENLRDKLIEKQSQGVMVRVILFRDGVNNAHGVDLSGIKYHKEIRGERGGLMHDKFCVIDNVTTISGSYNWTTNAENKNDEDISVTTEDYKHASSYTKRFNEMWERKD